MSTDSNNDSFDRAKTIGEVVSSVKEVDLREGTRVHRYLIVDLIGKGGMGAVYKAYDPELDRRIAIKVMTAVPEVGETVSRPQARLMREAQALAKLNHPNVVSVFDVGTYENGIYIAMEYVEGKTLRQWLEECKPSQKEILDVFVKAGRGLQAAHAEGIVHRDFKPENLLLSKNGEVKVLDFGLARTTEFESTPALVPVGPDSQSSDQMLSQPLTQVGALIGTTAYMAPEHFLHEKLDERTDQFSFCVSLFEALYGARPFVGGSLEKLKDHVTQGLFHIPTAVSVPRWIQDIVLRGLSVSKDDRYGSMLALLEDLGADPALARSQRRRIIMLALAFVLAAMIFFGIGSVYFRRSEVCSGASDSLGAIWNQEVKHKLRRSFAISELSYAVKTFDKVEMLLDDYLGRWAESYTDTCEATRIRAEQSEEMMDLKMQCLRKRLREVKALIKIFSRADAVIVGKAIQAGSTLTSLASCTDEETLKAAYPPPTSEQAKKKVELIHDKLADVEALQKTGKYKEGLNLVHTLTEKARNVAFRPIQAEVLLWLGIMLEKVGEYQKAETALDEAASLAGQSRDAGLAAKAMAELVWVVGYQQARKKAGLLLGKYTAVMLNLAGGGSDALRSRFLNSLGGVLWTQGVYDKALEHFHQALEIQEKAFGPEHPQVASTLNNLGALFYGKEDYPKALETFRRVLAIREKVLGRQHPQVASTLSNIGTVLSMVGQYEQALEFLQRSLLMREKILGPDHPLLAYPLEGIGKVYFDQGRPQEALAPLERLVKICQNKTCNPDPYGRGLFTLAQTLLVTGADREQAIRLAKRGQSEFSKAPKAFRRELEEMNVWLEKHARGFSTAHR